MIVETCPKCNGILIHICLTSDPPQDKVLCQKCGYEHTKKNKIVYIPYNENEQGV